MSRSIVAALLLAVAAAGCAGDPGPPAPIRPVGKDVVLAWTIEDALYDNGLARATEVVTIRYLGIDGQTEIQDYGRVYRGDQRPRKPNIFRHQLTAAQMDQLQHAMTALELPDVNRRQERPGIVPWTMWGICVPSRAGRSAASCSSTNGATSTARGRCSRCCSRSAATRACYPEK